MRKLAAVAVIVLGCRVAKCQGVAGGNSPMAQDSKKIVFGVKDTVGSGGRTFGAKDAANEGRVFGGSDTAHRGNLLGLQEPVGGGRKVVRDTAGDGGRSLGTDTIREVSMATGWGSKADTVPRINWSQGLPAWKQPFPYQSFFVPAVMIAYGATAVHNGTLQKINGNVKEQVWEDNPHSKTHIDNFLMFSPALAVYGLNALGIHGQHNFKDRTMLYLMANVFAQGSVFAVKGWSHELRPDGSNYMSFPSGHTAEAFASAEFMRLEYKDVSPWYGVAGYALATATGALRMYNNAHWFSDVVAGAGIGIASTRLAYWLYPKMQHWFGKKDAGDKAPVTMLTPTYQNGAVGLSYIKVF